MFSVDKSLNREMKIQLKKKKKKNQMEILELKNKLYEIKMT